MIRKCHEISSYSSPYLAAIVGRNGFHRLRLTPYFNAEDRVIGAHGAPYGVSMRHAYQ
jgi:hypothetical protein